MRLRLDQTLSPWKKTILDQTLENYMCLLLDQTMTMDDDFIATQNTSLPKVPTAVDNYLGTKLDDALLKVLERHTEDLIEKYSVLPGPESVKNQESEKSPKEIIKAKKERFDQKSALFSHMNKKKSANKNKTNYRLYHALMEALIADEDAMDKEVADKVKDHKRKHDSDDDDEDDDDDEGPSAGSNQGTKRRRSESAASGSSAKPPPKADDQSSKKTRESEASAIQTTPSLLLNWTAITNTRRLVLTLSMQTDLNLKSDIPNNLQIQFQCRMKGMFSYMRHGTTPHIPKVSTTTWFKPIPESERPATPEPEWTIPPNDFPEPEHNWANAYATSYKVPEENKLQRKTYDIGSFIKWFCRRTGKKKLWQS
ncbi:hypothetical protein Tco_0126668 [Tanacetum coccineum]